MNQTGATHPSAPVTVRGEDAPAIDHAAVAALRDEPVPWSTKGWPLDAKTMSPADLAGGRPRLDQAGFTFPLMTLTESDLANDIETTQTAEIGLMRRMLIEQ